MAIKPKKQMPANKGETGGGAKFGTAIAVGAAIGLARDKKKAAPKPTVKPKPKTPAKPTAKPKPKPKQYKDATDRPGFKYGKGTE